jgi:hypothetical protein
MIFCFSSKEGRYPGFLKEERGILKNYWTLLYGKELSKHNPLQIEAELA